MQLLLEPLPSDALPPGVRARHIEGINGLRMHLLEAGHETTGRPLLLLLHGFPELAYSWRNLMRPLADAGFHVVAPDQRGYGRTTGQPTGYDLDLRTVSMLQLTRDAIALAAALGHRTVHTVIGHDFGSPVAAWCALIRPDIFRSVVLMSAPFAGPPTLATVPAPAASAASAEHLDASLAALPRPRKHYHWYYATPSANADMRHSKDGLHAFLRAYFHHKSGDFVANAPHPLADWSATEMAQLPTYYVMDRAKTMAETVAPFMPAPADIAACHWLPDAELAIYTAEYGRTGFQGGLNWYRTRFDATVNAELTLFADRTIDVPSLFIAGARDWGYRQAPGAFERMQISVCTDMRGCHLIAGAGHWVMQEKPDDVTRLVLAFCGAPRTYRPPPTPQKSAQKQTPNFAKRKG
jgi:pimeloyl-ACP methyl ester carboxylesterase